MSQLTLLRARFARSPQSLRNMLALIFSLLTFRNALILFCLLNIKNLPLVWELRLVYRSYRAWKSKRDVLRLLNTSAASASLTVDSSSTPLPASAHPIFAPLTISTIAPQLEIDHNFHKSNSTYFSDLDESRTALMVHLLSSTRFSPAELEREGIKGAFAVMLGSVHASFLKEIKPYERYSIRSRILGWDEKWILIGSVFVRPKRADDVRKEAAAKRKLLKVQGKSDEEIEIAMKEQVAKDKDINEVLFATCLSKYVVKKGRYTVPPERSFRSAGWLPDKPAGQGSATPLVTVSSGDLTPDVEPVEGEIKLTEADLRRRAQETAAKAAEKLRQNSGKSKLELTEDDKACRAAASKWRWEDIDAERKRGMKVAESWLGLDKSLRQLWEDEISRKIVKS